MVTRAAFVESSFFGSGSFATTYNSGTFTTQVGDIIVAFGSLANPSNSDVFTSVTDSVGSAFTLAVPSSLVGRNNAACYYKIVATARASEYVIYNNSSFDNRQYDVVVYRPASGATLSVGPIHSGQNSFTTSVTSSSFTTTTGGVIVSYVRGPYSTLTVTSGYTAFNSTTSLTFPVGIAEKITPSIVTSETINWSATAGNDFYGNIVGLSIYETGIYEFGSFNRGIGRGIARGIA
jgi:hypothetical protein